MISKLKRWIEHFAELNEEELDQLQQKELPPYLDDTTELAIEVETFPENEADDHEERGSVQSSVTLGSTHSGPQRKRSFDEIDDEAGENEEVISSDSPGSSPCYVETQVY